MIRAANRSLPDEWVLPLSWSKNTPGLRCIWETMTRPGETVPYAIARHDRDEVLREPTEEELAEDHLEEMRELVEEMEYMTTEEVEEGVYKKLRFDLCPSCKAIYLRDPLFQRQERQGRRINFGEN